jgi:hypothetical protein
MNHPLHFWWDAAMRGRLEHCLEEPSSVALARRYALAGSWDGCLGASVEFLSIFLVFFSPKEKWHLKFSCKYIFIFLKKNKLGGWGMESAHTVA